MNQTDGCIFLWSASLLQASWRSLLVSRKLVPCERNNEGSGTTKTCTDKQEVHMRPDRKGK